MTTATGPNPATGRTVIAAVFAILAVVFVVAGIAFAVLPANSLPGFLGHLDGSTGHHPLRAVGSLLVGVVFAVAAWFSLRYKSPEEED
ncbi:MAG: hypothetical protein FWE35_22390 [Streptosporangiales bacterium]|nr:hypothetical protein [Streptosporangiales bacterium]